MDPSALFSEVPKTETKSSIDQIAKGKKKAEGYEEDETLYEKLKASDFIFNDGHLEKLGKCRQVRIFFVLNELGALVPKFCMQ